MRVCVCGLFSSQEVILVFCLKNSPNHETVCNWKSLPVGRRALCAEQLRSVCFTCFRRAGCSGCEDGAIINVSGLVFVVIRGSLRRYFSFC
jgi:hypothetical protein